MRRLIVPLLCTLAALFPGAGPVLAQAGAADPVSVASPPGGPPSVGIAFIGKSSQAERTLDGFFERMKEIAPAMKTERISDLADAEALGAAAAALAARHDGVIVMRSNGSEWLAENALPVPAFTAGGNHPPTLGSVMNMDAPEGNVTGVTYFLDHRIVMEIFVAMFPQALSWEVFTQAGHPAAPIDADGIEEACGALYLTCTMTALGAGAELPEAIRRSQAEAFLIGNQAPLYDDPAVFAQALEAAGERAVFALNAKPVEMGAVASMTADDHRLGRMLADRVVAVLRDGRPIREVPVGRDPEPTLVLNAAALERLGIHPPRQMMALSEMVGD
ncbi:ABC transporter substrate binding protein [Albimonas pacifica]|uniref:Putative ABC transport system substrate-binding protein n=1 Tax=Albimonas pacifica TaxID=1114924 RepID=A0A1I3MBD0_9RHOB|nr:ABC transporter substrate binding protein [Albimonas pacifica]SFI94293.1 putative ABC transport system substrate-binding protein [Albimonas pacifica]